MTSFGVEACIFQAAQIRGIVNAMWVVRDLHCCEENSALIVCLGIALRFSFTDGAVEFR